MKLEFIKTKKENKKVCSERFQERSNILRDELKKVAQRIFAFMATG